MAEHLRKHKVQWIIAICVVPVLITFGWFLHAAQAADPTQECGRRGLRDRYLQRTLGSTTVTTAWTPIGSMEIDITPPELGGMFYVEVENAGTNGIDDFRVQLMDHPDGEWYTVVSGTDWDTATELLPFIYTTSNTPDDLAASEIGHFHMQARGYAMRFDAKTAADTTDVVVRFTLGQE